MEDFENKWWHRIFRKFSILLSIECALVIVLSYYTGLFLSEQFHFLLPQIAGLWCAISGILVLQVLIHEVLSAAWLRVLGSFLGAVTSYVFTSFMGYTIPALALCVLVTVMIISLLNIKTTVRLACLTATVIIIVGAISPTISPFMNAFSRFIESAIGSAFALIITVLFFPLRKKLQLLNH